MRSEYLAATALALFVAALPGRAQTDDAVLKAAYIYNIAQFTVWPANAGTRPLNVCVASGHALWQSLRQLHGKPVGERKVAVVEPAAGTACDVTVLRAGAVRPAADGTGMLAVVDEPATGYAGAVALVEEDQHLRFDIDTKEAARAGLRFSSRLLRLARNVR
ncbi:YfiR family protein [Pseudoduganella lutea]|uniref:YfiR family protein n=1 Tax=Pseudoduganella lutea TaxID=321985 RepID=A0A4P6L596_9BURK|nr:YfiR family protein [Pseudoduganella lutea]QBE66799.1 YfiR family protein [Pseudoduganella lutea]